MASPAQIAAWFDSMPTELQRRLPRALMAGGQILESQIKANATGRPGPRAPTGAYRRSWNTRPIPGLLAVSVGTNAPQGRRLELGFSGVDSLGRVYDQPAFPHVAPAMARRESQILELIMDTAEEATNQ